MTTAVLLDLDVVISSIMDSFEDDADVTFAGKAAYNVIFSLADSNLENGSSVIIDSPCKYENVLEQGIALAKKHNAPYKFIDCFLDLENLFELNHRRTVRKILPSQKSTVPLDEDTFLKTIAIYKRPIDYEYLSIDTSQDIEKYIGKAVEYLNK
jgi:hypothetical protein